MPLTANTTRMAKRHHGPDVVHARRGELFQIDRIIDNRNREEQHRRIGRRGIEYAVEDGADQQSDGSLGRAYHRHQHNRQDQEEPVPAGISEEAQQFLHARTRKRSSASFTCRVLTDSMPAGPGSTSACVRHGAQIDRIGRAEYNDHRNAERRRHVGRARIVAQKQRRAGDERFDFGQRRAGHRPPALESPERSSPGRR